MSTSCHGVRFGVVRGFRVTCQLAEAGPMRRPATLCAPHSSSKLEDEKTITTMGPLRTSFALMVAR